MIKPWTIDFETKAIDGHIPPEPTSLAAKQPDGKTHFYSWGHPDSPNPTEDLETATRLLFHLFATGEHVLCHNAKFDIGVAQYHWGLGPRDPLLVHDTMFLLFLHNPYSNNLSLKPSAAELLNWPPDEQDAAHDWIMQHVPEAKPSTAGAYLSRVPYPIIAPYAEGDVDRTRALFDLLYPKIEEAGMVPAYQREQALMPILYESEQRGIRVNREALEDDLVNVYEPALIMVEEDLRARLKTPDLDFGQKGDVADALDRGGYIGEWVLTKTGRRSLAKNNLEKAVNDPSILHMLRYRGGMAGILQTFGRPWLEDTAADSRLHTSWNQVRTRGSHDQGTRTGRLSASRPNLMNVPNELRMTLPEGYPAPPFMRQYMLPEEGHVWLKRDFSSQEVRILAHFEDGALMQAYHDNPSMDPHTTAVERAEAAIGVRYLRKSMKDVLFGMIYGQGVKSLAEQLGITPAEASGIREALYTVFPGIKTLQGDVSKTAERGRFVTTWGGRQYYAEPAQIKKGRHMSFAYKVLNYLIQGSAADQTKDCIRDWHDNKDASHIFLATVHDEVNISAPADDWERAMGMLQDSMERDVFDVPMRSDGFYGPNWFDMEECT